MTVWVERFLLVLAWPGLWLGFLWIVLIVAVLAVVVAAQLGVNTLFSWEKPVFLFDRAITTNTLLDMQWHIFAIVVLFGGVSAYVSHRHVAVETVSAALPARWRNVLHGVFDLVFTFPFAVLMTFFGWSYARIAWETAERSTYGGMQDRWVVKGALPVAFALLGVAALARGLLRLLVAVRGKSE